MLKALLKKQLLEFFSGFFMKNNGKKHTVTSKTGFIVLLIVMIAAFSGMFFSMAYMLAPVIEKGYGWIYLSVFGVVSFLFGLMGSVFTTYNTLYDAKDNDSLMSMPIPSHYILFARMTGLYITSMAFGAIVLIPSMTVYFMIEKISMLSLLFAIINIFIIPFAVLSVSGILGFFIALFLSRLRNKSAVTVIASLGFFAVYYFFSLKISTIIDMIINNAYEVGELLKKYLHLFYRMGQGISGNTLSYLIYLTVVLLLFMCVYIALSKSFLKLALIKNGVKKTEYKEKTHKKNSKKVAFFKKELLYFKNTPIYILNCSLGSLMMIIAAVITVVKGEELLMTLALAGFSPDKLAVVFCLTLCFIAGTNNMTSVSVSLDAKNLWLLKSSPAEVTDIFFGKIMLHFSVTAVPYIISSTIIFIASGFRFTEYLMSLMCGILFILLCAVLGLIINIIAPKTDWTNEAVAIKQSASGFVGMFIGLVFTLAFFLTFVLITDFVTSEIYLLILSGILALFVFICYRNLGSKYKDKFMSIE